MSLSTSELTVLLKQHMEYSKESHERTLGILDNQNDKLEDILIQATRTNGRVLKLEKDTDNLGALVHKNAEDIQSFKGDRNWILGAFAVVVVGSSVVWTAILENISLKTDQTIKNEIAILREEYDQNNQATKK